MYQVESPISAGGSRDSSVECGDIGATWDQALIGPLNKEGTLSFIKTSSSDQDSWMS